MESGEGTSEFLEFADLVQASGDFALQAAIGELFEAVPGTGNPPRALLEEFQALLEASGNAEIAEAFNRLGEPSPEVIEELRVKFKSLRDPSLEGLFESAYASEGEGFEAFFQGMLTALRETLK